MTVDNNEKYKGMTYRDLLIHVATLMEVVVEHEIPNLKKENQRLNKRINGIRFFAGGLTLLGTAVGSFFAQLRQGG